MRARAALATVGLVAAGLLGACSEDQDPGLTPPTNDGPSTTSHTLPPCAEDPAAPVPVGGCLDPEGRVVNPDAGP